jgi:peroxiredoxin Q/BCP
MAKKLSVGDKAPDFVLPTQSGGVVSLHDFAGSKNVVLYFYPKDFTRGCTTEALAFGENYAELKKLDAEVIGVSSDSVESHRGFAVKCNVSFIMASDEGGKVRDEYGVPSTLGLIPGRVTYIIDKQGVVRHLFSSQMNPKRHVGEALEALQRLSDRPAGVNPADKESN